MAEDITQATEGTEAKTAAAAQSGDQRTFTQEEVNRLVGDARKKVRAQYEGYVDGSEVEELKATAQKAADELERLKAEASRAETVARVADAANVPSEVVAMLNGADEDALSEQVRRLLKLLPAYPTRTDDGGAKAVVKKSNAERFAEALGI